MEYQVMTPPMTVITTRRPQLLARLDAAQLPRTFVALDEIIGHRQRCPLTTTVLLDTIGLNDLQLCSTLAVLRRLEMPLFALVAPTDRACLRLLPFCPPVRLLVADTSDLALIGPFVRQMRYEHPRYRVPRDPWVIGVPRAEPSAITMELPLLLHALMQASTMEDAAERSGLSRISLQRNLKQIRQALALPTGTQTRYAPPEMAAAIYSALAQ